MRYEQDALADEIIRTIKNNKIVAIIIVIGVIIIGIARFTEAVFLIKQLFGLKYPQIAKETYDFDSKLQTLARSLINNISKEDQKNLSLCYYPFFPETHKQSVVITEKFITAINLDVSRLIMVTSSGINEQSFQEQQIFSLFIEERKTSAQSQQCNSLLIGKFIDYTSNSGFNKTLLKITMILLDGRQYSVHTEWFNM